VALLLVVTFGYVGKVPDIFLITSRPNDDAGGGLGPAYPNVYATTVTPDRLQRSRPAHGGEPLTFLAEPIRRPDWQW
jgi:hypothetical protein